MMSLKTHSCPSTTGSFPSIFTSNCQRSMVSRVSLDMMARTRREMEPDMSQAGVERTKEGEGGKGELRAELTFCGRKLRIEEGLTDHGLVL